jgi:cysteine-rich repeat protein
MTMPARLAACAAECKAVKYCGDGVEQPEEACDDGNDNDVDECSNKCLLPVCGDGIRQGSEECEDMNQEDDDDCSNECILARYIFVSSATYTGSLGGVAGGNLKCKMLAEARDLKGKSWRAWLSDGDVPLSADIKDFEGWYRLPDGFPVVKGASGLFLGSLTHSINVDEKKALQMSVPVWTGTKADGTAQADHCGKWTSDSDEIGGTYGDSGKADSNWTEKKLNNISQSLGCNITTAHIYCIQI